MSFRNIFPDNRIKQRVEITTRQLARCHHLWIAAISQIVIGQERCFCLLFRLQCMNIQFVPVEKLSNYIEARGDKSPLMPESAALLRLLEMNKNVGPLSHVYGLECLTQEHRMKI